MKKIYNPTENEVKIAIKGNEYSVEAGACEIVKDDVAEKWYDTHQFLQVGDVVVTTTVKEEKTEEVKEEVMEVKKEPLIKRVAKKVASKK